MTFTTAIALAPIATCTAFRPVAAEASGVVADGSSWTRGACAALLVHRLPSVVSGWTIVACVKLLVGIPYTPRIVVVAESAAHVATLGPNDLREVANHPPSQSSTLESLHPT